MDAKPKIQRREHILPLTGLRFLAALLVFVHHLPKAIVPTSHIPLGAIGVSFFFVLSGFILTYVYSEKIDSWKSIRKFWFARWARIWPVHLLTLLVCAFVVLGASHSFGSATEIKKFVLNVLLVQTWVPDLKWGMGFNHVSWSIATEAFFYLAFPFLILLTPKKFYRSLAMFGFAVAAFVVTCQLFLNYSVGHEQHALWLGRFNVMVNINPLLRLWEFMAGIAVGHMFLARRVSADSKRSFFDESATELTMAMVTVAYLWCWCGFAQWSHASESRVLISKWIEATFSSFIFIPVVYVFATRNGIISRVFSWRPLVYLGEISFAFYMIHQLVLRLISYHVNGFWTENTNFGIAVTLVISLALSAIVYELVEMPARNCLLALYRRQWKLASNAVVGTLRTVFTSPVTIAASTTVVIALFSINFEVTRRFERQFNVDRVAAVVSQSIIDKAAIQFGEDAVLHGATLETDSQQNVRIVLAWEKLKQQTRHRFIHIVDVNEKIINIPVDPRQKQNFLDVPMNRTFVEEIVLSPKELVNGFKIGIGLYSRDAGTAKVSSGNRSMGGHRLDLTQLDHGFAGRIALRGLNKRDDEQAGDSLVR